MAAVAPNTMSTSSSFRTSQSHSQSQSNAMPYTNEDNPLTHLPKVDFNFEDLRKRMADFTVKFDAFVERGRKGVLHERNGFRGRLSELHEEQRSTSTQITTLQSTLSSHHTLVSRESGEKSEIQSQIAQLEAHLATRRDRKSKLHGQIGGVSRAIEAKVTAQREYADRIDRQADLNGPELNFWETYLGVRIEGAGDEDLIRVVYSFPPLSSSSSSSSSSVTVGTGGGGEGKRNHQHQEREATFELKIPESGGGGYQVVYVAPKLDQGKVDRVVERLNESRDIGVLLKGMRGLFVEEMK